jgi:hypothetical protein
MRNEVLEKSSAVRSVCHPVIERQSQGDFGSKSQAGPVDGFDNLLNSSDR